MDYKSANRKAKSDSQRFETVVLVVENADQFNDYRVVPESEYCGEDALIVIQYCNGQVS
jgi:hypothetical protein